MKQIEASVRDAILSETTVVRTKNAVTIVSEYPVRHVQIVLRLYKSVSEILTGFDVDCACLAYDGEQVWAAPRALAAFTTQINSIDLTRRSPSYENRLSKYAHRGFEVYWPLLDRTRIDPTIFERAFTRVLGLARLLVLEKLPHPQDRDEYSAKRRAERGRPELPWNARFRHQLQGNIKDTQPDDVAEWVQEDEVSSYHTFTIPWGPRYTPKKIERLLYSKDLLLNAEWNKSKNREVNLHRHPAFFGRAEDIIQDCCGYCPKPVTDEDLAAWEEESKIFISGHITFLQDDPGRQQIGSFHPLTDDDWTDMAYIGNTTRLCQAIVDQDMEGVLDWLTGEEADVTKRDHTGRTPLQLAVMCSSEEIVQTLIDRGARINARLYNGLTALHLAAHRGNIAMVKALLDKSAENEAEEERKEEKRKEARRTIAEVKDTAIDDVEMTQDEQDDDEKDDNDSVDLMDTDSESNDSMTEGSFIKVKDENVPDPEDDKDDPDVYDVDVLAWDSPVSPLHLAIMAGHQDVIRILIDSYGADVLLPVKLMTNSIPRAPRAAILTLLLPLKLPLKRANKTVRLLLQKGASPLQADTNEITALHYVVAKAKVDILRAFRETNEEGTAKAINHLVVKPQWSGADVDSPLLSAIRSGSPQIVDEALSMGANPVIDCEPFARAFNAKKDQRHHDPDEMNTLFLKYVEQPIIQAAKQECMIDIVMKLTTLGADVNTLSAKSWQLVKDSSYRYNTEDKCLLDLVRDRRIKLENYSNEKSKHKEKKLLRPEPLESDDYYLQGLREGTYQYWSASMDLVRAKFIQNERARKYQHDYEIAKEAQPEPGEDEKKSAAASMAKRFEDVEKFLIEKGAKTFYELYPELKENHKTKSSKTSDSANQNDSESAYKTEFKFHVSDMTPSKHSRYVKLFEAAFAGDIEVVKDLCLVSNESTTPLQIAVNDNNGFNCFSLAILRGHQKLATTVLDIAAAQYEDKKETKQMKYSLHNEGVDDETDSDNDSTEGDYPKFYKQLVDEKFTIDDVDALAKDVKSRVKPLDMVNENCELWRLMKIDREQALRKLRIEKTFNPSPYVYWRDQKKPWAKFKACVTEESTRTTSSLWKYAIVTDNLQLLRYLFEMEVKYSMAPRDELLEYLKNMTQFLELAMCLGHVDLVGLIIAQRGTLLPLDHLAERSGIVIEEKPKYYQGLSVYGTKRNDWAREDRNASQKTPADSGSPLLNAVLCGPLDVIDYFMSDTPMRKYQEFAKTFEKDKRLRALAKGKGGVPAALRLWRNTRTNLMLHIAVMSWPAGQSVRLQYLLDKVPAEYLEVRSSSGDTPLQLALKLGNYPAFEILLAAGANQRTKDRKGQNLLHTIYNDAQTDRVALFKKIISMLDQSIVSDLLLERCSGTEPGSLTPFALYLNQRGWDHKDSFNLLDAMLELSGGKDLLVMDGAGDFPLHVEVRNNNMVKAKYFGKKRPDLLLQENATGMTPIEVAETRYFQSRMDNVPNVDSSARDNSILDKPAKDFVVEDEQMEEAGSDDDLEDEDDNLPTTHPIYASLVRIARKNPQARRLVSVLEANEVARRLAAQQHRKNAENRRREAQGLKSRWNRYYSRYDENASEVDQETDEQGKTSNDEVSKWYGQAAGWVRCVPWETHMEDTPESLEQALQKWRDFAEGKIEVLKCCEIADEKDRYKRKGHKKLTNQIADDNDV